MFKKLILSTAMLLISIAILGHAQSSMTFEASIDYTINIVTISGTVQEGGSWVSLYVEGPTNRLEYIGNTTVENNAYTVSFQLSNPVEGEYRVKIKAEGMDTPPLNESFNYTLPLSAPVLLSPQESDITSNTVNLSWNGAQGGAGDITYSVYVNENLYIDNISGTSYTVQNLSPQTQYDFKIIAKDSYQSEAVSNVISVTTKGSMTFQASIDYLTKIVTIFGTVQEGSNWVSLYVEGPTNRLEYIGNTTVENNSYSVSFELLDPVVGEYRVKIKAEGMDTPLTESFTYMLSFTAPELFMPEDCDITCSTVNLSWTAAQGGTGEVTYHIFIDGVETTYYTSDTYYTIPDLIPDTLYTFKIIANYGALITLESNEIEVVTSEVFVPVINEKSFLVTVNGEEFYSNMTDGGTLYRDDVQIYNVLSTWLVEGNGYIYFNSNGLKRINMSNNVPESLADCNPYYIVSDGNNIFYADWNDGGRIYKYTTGAPVLVCKDSALNLEINGDYLHYRNVKDGGKPYKVSKNAVNAESGTEIE